MTSIPSCLTVGVAFLAFPLGVDCSLRLLLLDSDGAEDAVVPGFTRTAAALPVAEGSSCASRPGIWPLGLAVEIEVVDVVGAAAACSGEGLASDDAVVFEDDAARTVRDEECSAAAVDRVASVSE